MLLLNTNVDTWLLSNGLHPSKEKILNKQNKVWSQAEFSIRTHPSPSVFNGVIWRVVLVKSPLYLVWFLFLDFQVGRRLSIKRTFKTADGKQFIRIEVVKNQAVIDAYLKFNKDKSIKYSFPSSFLFFI